MSYKAYEKYVDSGIEWFNNIPEHWDLLKIKHMIDYYTNGAWGSEKQNDNNDIICIRIADFDYPKRNIQNLDYTIRNISLNNKLILKPGDLLIEKSGGGEKQPVGRVVIFDKNLKATFSNFICKIKIKDEYDSRFICYMFNMLYSSRVNTKSIKQTTGIQNLDSYAYFDEIIAIPNILEQQQISNYLDKQTAKIDATIAKNEELIQLLEEKRVALINQVVTKGLNPDVPMKDSGVEWIGEIPKHWNLDCLKHNVLLNAKTLTDTTDDNYEFDYVDISSVSLENGIEKYEHMYFVDAPSRARRIVKKDDVIISTVRTYLKSIAIIPDKENIIVSTGFAVLTPSKIDSRYLGYMVKTEYFTNLVSAHSVGVSYPAINSTDLVNLDIIIPPDDEQKQIANYLDYEVSNINDIIIKVTENINLLEEYKTSLIHHVVTGKIDVRGDEI